MTIHTTKMICVLTVLLMFLSVSGCNEQKSDDSVADKVETVSSNIGAQETEEERNEEELDAAGTQRVQDSLMNRMEKVTQAQDQQVDKVFADDFDNSAEQHRQHFIDQTLEKTEQANDDEAKKLVEKLENAKEVEHSPIDDAE